MKKHTQQPYNPEEIKCLYDEFIEFFRFDITPNTFYAFLETKHPDHGYAYEQIMHFCDECSALHKRG